MSYAIANQSRAISNRRRGVRFWRLLLLPLAALLIYIAWFLITEYRASLLVRDEVQAIRDSQLPVDDESLTQHFYNSTSQQQTIAWRELLAVVNHLQTRAKDDYRIVNDTDSLYVPLIAPETNWISEPLVAEYLSEAKPALDRLAELAVDAKPTWQPLNFNGSQTLLPDIQACRQISELLSTEFQHAVYKQDGDRALTALQLDAAAIKAFDWQLFFVADLVQFTVQMRLLDRIRQSLSLNLWNELQLEAIVQLIGPEPNLSKRWRTSFAANRAVLLQSSGALEGGMFSKSEFYSNNGNRFLFPQPASQRLNLIKQMNQCLALGDGGYEGLSQRVANLLPTADFASHQSIAFRYFFAVDPAFVDGSQGVVSNAQPYAKCCEEMETSRRLIITALAIKRFQLQNKKWPESLGDLSQVGLSSRDSTNLDGQPFGYKISADEQEARIKVTGIMLDNLKQTADKGWLLRIAVIR